MNSTLAEEGLTKCFVSWRWVLPSVVLCVVLSGHQRTRRCLFSALGEDQYNETTDAKSSIKMSKGYLSPCYTALFIKILLASLEISSEEEHLKCHWSV